MQRQSIVLFGKPLADARGSKTGAEGSLADARGSETGSEESLADARGSETGSEGSLADARGSETGSEGSLARGSETGSEGSLADARGSETGSEGSLARGSETGAGKPLADARGSETGAVVKSWIMVGLLAAGLLQAQGVIDKLPDEDSFARASGKNVQPFFEGWQQLADGRIVMWFGYLNRNYEEQPDIPIGADNKFDLREDMGQPTHFYPRRNLFVFPVELPKDWDKEKRLVWTLTCNGRTSTANGWLQPEWEIDDGVIQMNIGPGGAPPVDPPNAAPKISGSGDQAIDFGKSAKLAVSASDDGIPKPRVRSTQNANNAAARMPLPAGAAPPPRAQLGLRIRWILYRGPMGGEVAFEPDTTRPVVGGQAAELTAEAKFSAPGTYWLRAIASDGLLETPYDVKVTVRRPGSASR